MNKYELDAFDKRIIELESNLAELKGISGGILDAGMDVLSRRISVNERWLLALEGAVNSDRILFKELRDRIAALEKSCRT